MYANISKIIQYLYHYITMYYYKILTKYLNLDSEPGLKAVSPRIIAIKSELAEGCLGHE